MSSDLQLTLLLKKQAEDIYERNGNSSLIAWREYREEVRKRIYPKNIETPANHDSEEFNLSPYRTCLSKYRDNLVQQRHKRSLREDTFSPKRTLKEKSFSSSNLVTKAEKEDIERAYPLSVLIQLEYALHNCSLNSVSKEYSGKLRSIANLILDKIN